MSPKDLADRIERMTPVEYWRQSIQLLRWCQEKEFPVYKWRVEGFLQRVIPHDKYSRDGQAKVDQLTKAVLDVRG
jgi:hypothetical protein